MGRPSKPYSAAEKSAILQEALSSGMLQTCRKYTISPKTYYQWRDKFDAGGVEALNTPTHSPDPELLHLRKENERLKRLLGEKELIISVKDELLKKTTFRTNSAVRLPQ
jgi:putative transposase